MVYVIEANKRAKTFHTVRQPESTHPKMDQSTGSPRESGRRIEGKVYMHERQDLLESEREVGKRGGYSADMKSKPSVYQL